MYLNYRDTLKPNPIWEEVAVYGGYKWIELPFDPNVWVSRRWESQVILLKEYMENTLSKSEITCNLSCIREFKDMLADNNILLDHMQTYKRFSPDMSAAQALQVVQSVKYAKDVVFVSPNSRNETKLSWAFTKQPVVYCIGYSELLASLVSSGKVMHVVSDKPYYDCETQLLPLPAIAEASVDHQVFIDARCCEAKSYIYNWANVINF